MSSAQLSIFPAIDDRLEAIRQTERAITLVKLPDDNHYNECLAFTKEFIKTHSEFTCFDVIEEYKKSDFPQPKEYRVFGSVITELKKIGIIECSGMEKSKNPAAHRRPVYKWRTRNISPCM